MFIDVKKALKEQFMKLVNQNDLFIVDVQKELLWMTYFESLHEKDKPSNNCNSCKGFIRRYGGVVAIDKDLNLLTLWDFETDDLEFQNSINQMRNLVRSSKIRNHFLTDSPNAGLDHNFSEQGARWEHYSLTVPSLYVKSKVSIPTALGELRSKAETLERAVVELSLESIQIVSEMIQQKVLYKYETYKTMMEGMLEAKLASNNLKDSESLTKWCWKNAKKYQFTASIVRNSGIGTLLVDLNKSKRPNEDEDVFLDRCLKSYEHVTAPSNWKRPKALITEKEKQKAREYFDANGLTPSLSRRYATDKDLNVNNMLFVNKPLNVGLDVFDSLPSTELVDIKKLSKVEEMTIEDFVKNVLPTAKQIELLVENKHTSNFMTLVTASYADSKSLFKWSNPFSWSYANAVTDAIKETVKKAGGDVEGQLRISLAWDNSDDLDLSVTTGNETIYYGNKRHIRTGLTLDVDMNAGSVQNAVNPVENITISKNFRSSFKLVLPLEVIVTNFSKRNQPSNGFTVQIESNGQLYEYPHKPLRHKEKVSISRFMYDYDKGIIAIDSELNSSNQVVSKTSWGIETNKFQNVKLLMNSPNYWTDESGQKHYFFILEDAVSEEVPRAFFNEFLKDEHITNKKFFEAMTQNLVVEPSSSELSGVGFSNSRGDEAIVRVTSSFKRNIKIKF